MNEETRRRLEQDSPALAGLYDKLIQAADCVLKEGFSAAQDGKAFVSENVLKRFEIEPVYEWVLVDTITALLREHPMIKNLTPTDDGYRIDFQPIVEQPAESGHSGLKDEDTLEL